jgi:hypothetical protein
MYAHNETFARYAAYYGVYVLWSTMGLLAAGVWLIQ